MSQCKLPVRSLVFAEIGIVALASIEQTWDKGDFSDRIDISAPAQRVAYVTSRRFANGSQSDHVFFRQSSF